ncbi:MAG: phage major capsid protein [Burkholderiaceae bacterium]
MKTINIEAFKKGLAAAAKQHGEAGVTHAKSLMLEGAMLVDEAGTPIDPESIDIVLRAAAAPMEDAVEAPADEAKSAPQEEAVAKSVRHAIQLELAGAAPVRKSVKVLGSPLRTYKKLKNFDNGETAYRFARWALATKGHSKSAQFCADNGIVLKAHSEGVNEAGGFLVPEEFETTIITLREKFGVFRQNARVVPMGRDTRWMPRRRNGLTAYWVGETKAGTESTQSFDQVQLIAKKLMALTTMSSELDEDSMVNFGDDLANEIAYAFAKAEDEAGFLGDGTQTYGGIVGLKNAVGSAGVVDSGAGTGDLTTQITQAGLGKLFAKLPEYASGNAKIYCHKSVYHEVFERLAMAAGGVSAAEIASGAQPRYFGYPVVFSQALPASSTTTDGTVLAYFGDLAMGCYFGDRREMSVKLSDSALNAFEQDEMAVKGTQRVDIVCANVGDATNAGAVIQFTR